MVRLFMAIVITVSLYLSYVYVFTQPYMHSLHEKVDSLLGIHEEEHK